MWFENRKGTKARRHAGTKDCPNSSPTSCLRVFVPSCLPNRRRAFTLLEMMFVFVLIGILATLVTVNVRYYLLRGKQNAARAEIASICTALETFFSVNGHYPENDEGLTI